MKVFIVSLLLYMPVYCFAQKGMHAYGKIDKADLQSKDCSYDKGAEAEILIDWGNTYYNRGTQGKAVFKTIFEKRRRIKIYTEKGLTQAAVKIQFYSHSNEEQILRINACTYNLDAAGNIQRTEVSKNGVYTKRLNNYFSELIIAFPAVKPGSVIEYKYMMERETMGQLPHWYFQGVIPVRYSHYQLTIPQVFRFNVQPSVIDPIEKKQEVINERIALNNGFFETQSLRSNYIMRKLPGIKEEPFISTPKDYMQRLEFQLSQIDYGNGNIEDLRTSWSDVMESLATDDNFGRQLEKEIIGLNPVVKEAQKITGTEAQIKFLYNYLRHNFTWNTEESIYTSKNLSKIWDAKTGNSADINLLLLRLLTASGIEAHPVLFSTRDNGLVNPGFPFLQQFNTVMVYATAQTDSFILDATDKIAGYKLTPHKITNNQGFVATGENGKWITALPGKSKHKIITAISGEIDGTGNIKGDALINCFDYAKKQRVEKWHESNEAFKSDYFYTNNMGYKTFDITINNAENDSLPLEQKIKFAGALNGSGNYRYFTVNMFTGLDKNPFIASERATDIDFGCNQEYVIFGNYNIAPEYSFDELPSNVTIIMPDTSIIFSRSVQQTDNILNIRIAVDFKQPFYSANIYPEFAAFYKKMFALLIEQIVIKKKKQA
jgi:transglutaminase-like putative cysteine protease